MIATADSLDQTEHVIYDDTAALGQTIRTLDNPVGTGVTGSATVDFVLKKKQ